MAEIEKTRTFWKEVVIEEFYSKKDGKVFWNWRFAGGPWHEELTPYRELPWVEMKI